MLKTKQYVAKVHDLI